MIDFLNLLFGMSGPGENIARTEESGFIISTINTKDCGPETAIIDKNKTSVVERYSSIEEALKGHEFWVAQIKNGLRKIKDIGYGETIPEEERILEET